MTLDLSILITTSATPSNPTTTMIEQTIQSLDQCLSEAKGSKLFIIADGYKVCETKQALKLGKVNANTASNYEKYKENLKGYIDEYNKNDDKIFEISLIELETRHGFAGAVYEALSNHITSKNVMIVQHDWIFLKKLESGVINTLTEFLNNPSLNINYIGFVASSNVEYHKSEKHMGSLKDKRNRILQYGSDETGLSLTLTPLYFWYDRNHLANREFYLKVYENNPKLKTSSFIEDTFGQKQIAELSKDKSQKAFDKYGTYLYYPNMGRDSYIGHINGRKFLTNDQRQLVYGDELAKRKKLNMSHSE
jgi:hypothetical protein